MKTKSPKKSKKKSKKSIQTGKTREDLDKRAKEEEEATIQAEKEEAERKEKEAADAAKERKKRDKEELKKIRAQIPELMTVQARINVGLITARVAKKEQEDWEGFLNPSRPPNPKNLPQINAFIGTTEADQSNETIMEVLQLYSLFFQFLKTLDTYTSGEDITNKRQYVKTAMDLDQLMRKKINAATHNLLLEAKTRALHDGDFTSCDKNDCISVCIWANVSKNPRVRSIEFEERDIFVEINPFLNRLNCCIRVIFMTMDVASQRVMAAAYLALDMDLENESVQSLTSYQSSASVSSASKRSTYDPRALTSVMGIDLDTAYKDRQKNFPKIYIREAKQSHTRTQMAHIDEEIDIDDAGEFEFEDEDEEFDWDKYNLSTPPEEELVEEEEPNKYFDIHSYHSVGGVFQIELFALPYQPKTVKSWIIQMMVNPADVFPIPYNAENYEKSQVDTKMMQSPLLVSFKLPRDVHFFSEPQPALFDQELLKWSRNNFLNKVYNEATGQISFRILKFGIMTLMQDAHVNMPFRSFLIQPGSNNNVLHMNIVGRFTEVEFVLDGDLVCITKPTLPEISDVLNEFMPLTMLVKKMRRAGINFFPGPLSCERLSISQKKRGTIDRLYRQMSIFGNRASFKNSSWNTGVNDEEKIVFQFNFFRKNETPETWSLCCVTKRQARILKMQENSDTFSEEPINGFQSNVFTLFVMNLSNEQKELLKVTSPVFVNAFYELLKMTNPIVHAVVG